MYANGFSGQGIFRYLIQGQQTDGLLNQKKVVLVSIYMSQLLSKSCEIPYGYPDFRKKNYKIEESFSLYDHFEGISAVWSITGDKIDFSSGKLPQGETVPARNKIKLVLPDIKNMSPGYCVKIKTKSPSYYQLSFKESDSEEVVISGCDKIDEIVIPVKTGKEMSVTIPTNISVLDISYMK